MYCEICLQAMALWFVVFNYLTRDMTSSVWIKTERMLPLNYLRQYATGLIDPVEVITQ